jgi:hypothetical protein
MRKSPSALGRKLVVLPDAAVGDARLLAGESMSAPSTSTNDASWMVVGPPPWEIVPGLYLDGQRVPLVEWPPSDAADAPSDGTKDETGES